MTAAQFLAILRGRWRIALGLLAAAMAVAVAISLLLPPRYVARASVVIDVKAADPIAGGNSPAVLAPSYMATQVDIMESERVARQVVRALQLDQAEAMRSQWQRETGSQGDFESWLARLLQRRLEVRPVRESNILEIEFASINPRFSATVANAFAQAYLDTVLELRVEPARRYTEFFEDRSRQLRERLESAQAQLSAFQRSKGIVATDERLDQETARIGELSTQLVVLQAASADSRGRQLAAGIAPEALQDVINHPVVQGLRIELGRQEARLKELSARLGDAHPTLLETRIAVAELNERLRSETQRLSASVGINSILSESREAQVKSSLDAQRERVLQLRGARDEMTVLQRDTELAQRAYDAVSARLTQMSLESDSEQTNASLLATATEPSRASFPNWPLNLLLGLAAGLLLGMLGALGRESADRRVRAVEDVARELQLPLLGEVLPQGLDAPAAVELLRPPARPAAQGA